MSRKITVVSTIYGQIIAIQAKKTGKHRCDAECKRFGHQYEHRFKTGAKVYGLSNGDVLISRRNLM